MIKEAQRSLNGWDGNETKGIPPEKRYGKNVNLGIQSLNTGFAIEKQQATLSLQYPIVYNGIHMDNPFILQANRLYRLKKYTATQMKHRESCNII